MTDDMGGNTVEKNLAVWNRRWAWKEDGDEWKGQARRCGVPYPEWKQTLIDHLIVPYISNGATVMEIGPGHGRWTEAILARPCARVILVDISPTCLDACKSRFADDRLETFQSSGSDLPPDATGEVDVVWSYDVFVHIAEPQFREYLAGVARVLRAGGVAVIHHGNRRQATLGLGWLRSFRVGRHLYQLISMGHLDDDGWRSNVSGKQVAHWAADVGLTVRAQVCRWGLNSAYGVPRFNDRVTILQKPLGR